MTARSLFTERAEAAAAHAATTWQTSTTALVDALLDDAMLDALLNDALLDTMLDAVLDDAVAHNRVDALLHDAGLMNSRPWDAG